MALLFHSPEISRVFCYLNPNPIPAKHKAMKIFTNDKRFGFNSRVTVRARVEECEVRVSEGDHQNVRLYGQFSAPVKKQGSKPSKEEEDKQNYYVNMGYAIRTLREEFPELFYRELSFDIYRLGMAEK